MRAYILRICVDSGDCWEEVVEQRKSVVSVDLARHVAKINIHVTALAGGTHLPFIICYTLRFTYSACSKRRYIIHSSKAMY